MSAMTLSCRENTTVTRVRSFNSTAEPVLEMLRAERFTGEVTLHVGQGTVQVVEVKEIARLTE